MRTLVVTGRPLRVKRNAYIAAWEQKEAEVKELTARGVVPMMQDLEDVDVDVDVPYLMGQVCAVIEDVRSARRIVEDMVREAVGRLEVGGG